MKILIGKERFIKNQSQNEDSGSVMINSVKAGDYHFGLKIIKFEKWEIPEVEAKLNDIMFLSELKDLHLENKVPKEVNNSKINLDIKVKTINPKYQKVKFNVREKNLNTFGRSFPKKPSILYFIF